MVLVAPRFFARIFARPEEKAVVMDDAHVVTDGEGAGVRGDTEAHRAWKDRQQHLRQVQ
jgi:hypothetical protein